MHSKRSLVWWLGAGLVVLFVVLLALHYTKGPNQNETGIVIVGQMAPAISLSSTQGPVRLVSLRGHAVVLYFYEGNS